MTRGFYLGLFAVAAAVTACLPHAVMAAPAPATAKADAAKVTKYWLLMEMNGTTQNVRNVRANTRNVIRAIILEGANKTALTPEEEARFAKIADPLLEQTQEAILKDIADVQAARMSLEEINALIAVNEKPLSIRYNKQKFSQEEAAGRDVQELMGIAITQIVMTYKKQAFVPTPSDVTARLAAVDTPGDVLAQQLLKADGTEEIVFSFVNTSYADVLAEEVNKQIPLDTLSDADNTRLTAIFDGSLGWMGKNMLKLGAQRYAKVFTEAELKQLTTDFGIPAQATLTKIRSGDNSALDQRTGDRIQAAADKIIQTFEKP